MHKSPKMASQNGFDNHSHITRLSHHLLSTLPLSVGNHGHLKVPIGPCVALAPPGLRGHLARLVVGLPSAPSVAVADDQLRRRPEAGDEVQTEQHAPGVGETHGAPGVIGETQSETQSETPYVSEFFIGALWRTSFGWRSLVRWFQLLKFTPYLGAAQNNRASDPCRFPCKT